MREITLKMVSAVAGLFLIIGLGGCPKSLQSPQGMVLIPAGEFIMGTDKVDTEGKAAEFGTVKPWYLDEHPKHKVRLETYFIDQHEVTNSQYKEFVNATGSRPPEDWEGGRIPQGRETYPVAFVNWYDADRFCQWKGKRLPTEAEWEKAARGTDGRDYPWGNEFDPTKANTGDTGIGDLAPVGQFEAGKSPYGVYDMSGSSWNTGNEYDKTRHNTGFNCLDAFEKLKILRGSS